MRNIVDDLSGQYEKFRKSDEELHQIKSKKVREFYERQNEILVSDLRFSFALKVSLH